MRNPLTELLGHLDELFEVMDGMDCADYPMVPVLIELVQQDMAGVRRLVEKEEGVK